MKKELKEFAFDKYAKIDLTEDILSPVRYSASWLLPQAMAFLASDKFRLVRNDENKISMKNTINAWLQDAKDGKLGVSLDYFKGLFRVLNRAPRGEILGSRMTQSKPEGARWAASVPLILSAFKEYRNVKYAEWDYDPEYLKYFVDKNLEPLLFLYPYDCPFSEKELIDIRDETDNGKPLPSRISITNCSNAEFNKLPRYLKTLLCQVWVYHPSVRHALAITNLKDLDEPAKPLVTSDVFEPVTDQEELWKV